MFLRQFLLLTIIVLSSCRNGASVSESVNSEVILSDIEPASSSECEFNDNDNLSCWTRAGLYPIDSIAEVFACDLKNNNVTHILLAKYIGDNGAFPNESAFVFWTDSEFEFMKEFKAEDPEVVEEKPIKKMNWKSLRLLADSLSIDTVLSTPKTETPMSHNIGFSVQYLTSDSFFCDRLQDNLWRTAKNKNHPKVIFWKALSEVINSN